MKRYVYIVLGILSLILAVAGVILPGLPTTPFVLLSVWLFTHSSPLLLNRLMGNKMLNNYVTNYHERGGLSKKSKLFTILFMWCMVILSVVLQINNMMIKWIIICMALVGTYVMGFVVPTAKK